MKENIEKLEFWSYVALGWSGFLIIWLFLSWATNRVDDSPCAGIYFRESLSRCLQANR